MLSPGINTKEGNVGTTTVRSTNGTAALVGKFNWGPAYSITQISGDTDMIAKFGTPDSQTADYVLNGTNFLKYGNDLRVVRILDKEKAKNASALKNVISYTVASAGTSYTVDGEFKIQYNSTDLDIGRITEVTEQGAIVKVFVPAGKILAKMKELSLQDLTNFSVDLTNTGNGVSGSITTLGLVADSGIFVANRDTAKDSLDAVAFQTSTVKYSMPALVAAYAGEFGDTIDVEIVSKAGFDKPSLLTVYPYGDQVLSTAQNVLTYGPQTDDQYGIIVRVAGVVKESYVVSTKETDRDMYGSKIFMDDFFSNGSSQFISAVAKGWPIGFSGVLSLKGGLSVNSEATAGQFTTGWDMFSDREEIRVGSLIAGAVAGESEEIACTVQKHAVSIGEIRQDCVVLLSPLRSQVVNKDVTTAVDNMIKWRTGKSAEGQAVENNLNINSSYSFFDSNYKYQYDKYNDVNRWVPLAGDIAGLCARTDTVSYSWMSPAGYNRGQILDCIKLAVDTKQQHRDRLYQVQLNPVISTSGEGVILYGDKTATSSPTPFNRINVRRLSNMIKLDVSQTSKYKLFENNDAFTRADFRLSNSQYMKNIRTLGGVYDFMVVCDETNNTPQVIDSSEFVGTIFYKPARSINFITLNFVATSTGTNFDELVG